MSPEHSPWASGGYSDIISAAIVGGVVRVEFANGDLVDVAPSVAGDLAGAVISVDPDEAMSVKITRANREIAEISWMQIRAGSDPLFAQHLRDLDAEESRRLGLRLKALREDRGIAQGELARLVGMTAPQLSKIEAGTHDMRVSTIRSLLRAMGASFADVAGDDVPEVSLRKLIRQLDASGMPKERGQQLLGGVPRVAVYALLRRAFGWTQSDITAGQFGTSRLDLAVQFKSSRQQEPRDSPLISLAQAVARAGRLAAGGAAFAGVPSDPVTVRQQAMNAEGEVTLASLLAWAWGAGVPILPMEGRGGFSASVWDETNGPVVVVKEARDFAVFWLFDLAHELGHIARGHLASDSIVDLSSPTALDNRDNQEKEANEYALQLLVPGHEALLDEVRHVSGGNYLAFKGAVASVASRHRLNPGLLGMLAAHELGEIGEHKDRWGSATNLARADGPGREVARTVARENLALDQLDQLDATLLRTLVLTD